MEKHAQLCIYHKGKVVVDLVGSLVDPMRESAFAAKPYTEDSLQNVFSCSKAVTNMVLAMLVDRGDLTYDQTIASIWPEFAARGKAAIRVAP